MFLSTFLTCIVLPQWLLFTLGVTADTSESNFLKRQSGVSNVTSMYVWSSGSILNSTNATQVIDFASQWNVSRIYAFVNSSINSTTPAQAYGTFITNCTQKGIAVEALNGDPTWAEDSGRPYLSSWLDSLEVYQNSSDASSQFSGIHVDIEPYTLTGWNVSSSQSDLLAGWKESIALVVQTAHALNISAVATLPFWLHSYANPTNSSQMMDQWMMSQLDAVAVMSYRNTAAGVLNVGGQALSTGADYGTPVFLAVETLQTDEGSANYVSFYGKGRKYFLNQTEYIRELADEQHNEFAGIAVHDYRGWTAVMKSGSAGLALGCLWPLLLLQGFVVLAGGVF